jgi:hypothetical protein
MIDTPPPTATPEAPKKKPFAIVGTVIGFLALVAAFLSPWIAEAIDPPPPAPPERSLIEFALTIKNAAESGEVTPAAPRQKLPSDYLPPAVIAVGMIGAGFGLLAFFVGEPWRFATCAVVLGVGAAVVQWSIIIVAAVFGLLLLVLILSAMGIDLSP